MTIPADAAAAAPANTEPASHNVWRSVPKALRYAAAGVTVAALVAFLGPRLRDAWRQHLALASLDPPVRRALEKEDVEFGKDLAEAIVTFDDRDYIAARERFMPLLRTRTPAMRRLVEGYVTATFDGARQPEEGLQFLCRTYRDRPLGDVGARLDYHVFLRSIATSNGFNYAEDLVTKLRPSCPRRDLSYVWAGIPRAKAEHLGAGVTVYDDGYRLGRGDATYLRHVIQRYPSDAFLDHAFYFLYEFDTILREYPNTLIAEVVYRSAGQRALKAKNLDSAISYFTAAAQKWPQSAHFDEVCEHLSEAYRRKGEPETAFEWLSRRRAGKGGTVAVLLGRDQPFANSREVASFLRRVRQQRGTAAMRTLFESDCSEWFAIDSDSLSAGDYDHALAEYEDTAKAFREYQIAVPSCIGHAIAVLRRVVDTTDDSPADLLRLGFYLRDEAGDDLGNFAFAAVAADVWEECATRFPGTDEAEKSLYLAGAIHRRGGAYRRAANLFRRLAREYPRSHLRDDALAETGWYAYYYQDDTELARRYFRRVLAEHPRSNAADNALNWLARTYCHAGEYDKALSVYKQLTEDYGSGRLAHFYARHQVRALRPVVDSISRRNTIDGLLEVETIADPEGAYLSTIKADSEAERAGLEEADAVVAVGGETVDSADAFYELLSAAKSGDTVVLGIVRSLDSEIEIRAKVSTESFYAKEPDSSCGPLELY